MTAKLLASLVASLLSVLVLEGVARWLFRTPYQWDRRLMFYSEGHNFRNTDWGGFAYQPHDRVRVRTYYVTSLDPVEARLEFDYGFTTNANGLVQRNEIDESKPAIVLLGDSFTEGQGAKPWFYRLEHEWPASSPYQIVNGGIQGTGIEAWVRLYRALSTKLKIAKVAVIFISDDWTRFVWQYSPAALRCLTSGAQCKGSENYYGLSEDPTEAETQVNRIARYRVDYLATENVVSRSALYRNVVSPAFDAVTRFRKFGSFQSRDSKQFEINKRVAAQMVEELGRHNVLFIYLPQKSELDAGPKSVGRQANDFIRQSAFAFVDGRAQCGLTIRDYYERDGHPNATGYGKIAACIRRAIDTAFDPN